MDIKIKFNNAELSRLENAIKKATQQTAEEIKQDIKDAEVIPKKSGKLEDSLDVKMNDGTAVISVDTPYAQALYFNESKTVDRSINKNAQSHWFEPWISGSKKSDIVQKYGENLRGDLR